MEIGADRNCTVIHVAVIIILNDDDIDALEVWLSILHHLFLINCFTVATPDRGYALSNQLLHMCDTNHVGYASVFCSFDIEHGISSYRKVLFHIKCMRILKNPLGIINYRCGYTIRMHRSAHNSWLD